MIVTAWNNSKQYQSGAGYGLNAPRLSGELTSSHRDQEYGAEGACVPGELQKRLTGLAKSVKTLAAFSSDIHPGKPTSAR